MTQITQELENCRIASKFPLAKRLKAKVMFIEGDSLSRIEAETGIPKTTVHELVNAMGWRKLNSTKKGKVLAEEYIKEAAESVREWVDVLGVESQELALRGVGLARDAADDKNAKDYANAARGVHTFAQLARQSAGLDAVKPENKSSMSVFVVRVGDGIREKESINVTGTVLPETLLPPAPAVDVTSEEVEFEE
jgi:hypothetical protein